MPRIRRTAACLLDQLTRQCSACGPNILAARIAAHYWLADMPRQRISERAQLIGRRWVKAAGEIGHLDEIEPNGCITDQLTQGSGIVLTHVLSRDADIGQGHPVPPGLCMPPRGRHDRGHGSAGGQWHEARLAWRRLQRPS